MCFHDDPMLCFHKTPPPISVREFSLTLFLLTNFNIPSTKASTNKHPWYPFPFLWKKYDYCHPDLFQNSNLAQILTWHIVCVNLKTRNAVAKYFTFIVGTKYAFAIFSQDSNSYRIIEGQQNGGLMSWLESASSMGPAGVSAALFKATTASGETSFWHRCWWHNWVM
jgi:hypothetical protein